MYMPGDTICDAHVCFRFLALLYFTAEMLVPGSKTLCAGALKPWGNLHSLLLFSSFFLAPLKCVVYCSTLEILQAG